MTAEKPEKNKEIPASTMIISAGGVVWKEAEIGPEIAVVHRPKYDDWSLPKGMLKKDESFEDAALRAVREETGLKVRISDFAGETAYEHDGINKIVMYWNMVLIEESSFKKSDKADKLEWLSLKDAFQKISYQEQKTLITNLYKYQKPLVFEKLGFIKSLSIAVRRLQSTIQSFKIEMNRKVEFQRREGNLDTTWVNAANSLLDLSDEEMRKYKINSGWNYLHAAGRMEIFGLTEEELKIKALLLRHEAEKLKSWRKAATYELIGEFKDPKQEFSKESVYQAALLRDKSSDNLYLKIDHRRRSLYYILGGLVVILIFLPSTLKFDDFQNQIRVFNILVEVEFFGALGALLSVSMTLTGSSVKRKIPDQLLGSFVIWMRPAIGASAAVAMFVFLQADLLGSIVSSDLKDSIYAILTFSFVAGFSERFIMKVIGSVDKEKFDT